MDWLTEEGVARNSKADAMNPPPYSEKEPFSFSALNHPAAPPYSMDHTAPSATPPPYQPFYICSNPGSNQGLFVQPPQAVIITSSQPTNEPDFMAYSIFTTLCCFLPLGITALVFSFQTRQANKRGDQTAAQRLSVLARSFAHLALGIGILLTFLYVSVLAVFFS